MTDDRDTRESPDEAHVAGDLAAGQGSSDAAYALPAEDVAQLAGIRDDADQQAYASGDEVDRLGEMTDTGIYQGDLEARAPGDDQPDDPEAENLETLLEDEMRAGETADAGEAAEEGLTWVPPTDPPVVPGDDGQIEVAAGFGASADDEPFDADHHDEASFADDERSERVREALRAHAATSALADRLEVEMQGPIAVLAGSVDDVVDEDAVVGVASEVEGVRDVVSRIRVEAVE
jgi:hypothetical protein